MAILKDLAAQEEQIATIVSNLFGGISKSQIDVKLTSGNCTIQITSVDGLSLTKFEYNCNAPDELLCSVQRAQIVQNYPTAGALSFAAMPATVSLTTLLQIRSLCRDLQEDKDGE